MNVRSLAHRAEDFRGATVLVVGDDQSRRALIDTELEEMAADVVEASGWDAASEVLRTSDRPVDLVLVDMATPEQSVGVLEALAAGGSTAAAIVVMECDEGLRRRAFETGVFDVIAKPVDRIELQVKCRALLELIRRAGRSEERVLQDRQRYDAILASTPSAVSVLDPQLRYTLVNDAFCELFGQSSPDEVVGRFEDEVLPVDVLERSRRALDGLVAGEGSTEEELIARGAESISVMTQRFPLRNSAGAITELVTIRTDITHRKAVEREAAERAMWETRIAAAIADGRLLVYGQPIVDIATGQTVESELLVRLRSAETTEILPPSAFIPQCERYGLMPMIDQYMVGRAIALATKGNRVCVNITGQTVGDATAMSEIVRALIAAGPDVTQRILFEITETTVLASPPIAEAFSLSMRSVGCRVALDDFGTGYGTFTELRHLDLDSLKIDISFVQNMLQNRDDERVVNTIAFVARAYGLATVAEGVETEAVLAKLAELGVDRAQGYLFGKPMPMAG